MTRPFLGVSRSALGRPWRDRLDLEGLGRAEAIAQLHGHPELLARVLAGRGVGPDDVVAHLDPTIRALMPDPDTLTDMSAAAARLADAIERGETVAIFGDYDVDGACSAALLGGFLEACGTPYVIHIPDRIFEGYGPNVDAIRALAEAGASLLVTVDCGTTSHEPLAEARRLGMGIIVLDHHQAPESLPAVDALVKDSAVYRPSREGSFDIDYAKDVTTRLRTALSVAPGHPIAAICDGYWDWGDLKRNRSPLLPPGGPAG